MCGICGIAGHVDAVVLERMTDTLFHRGPDDKGILYAPEHCVGFGMRRLAIIDLPGGRQPVHNEDKSVWIVFNGEIYNYRELSADLRDKGHRFSTQSDTEVIVHLYEEYGDTFIHSLRGMFALAICDARLMRNGSDAKLVLARDRLGIKPLYYWHRNGKLVFASEIKAILEHPEVSRELDLDALDLYLSLQYVPGPRTMFRGIRKLLPGHTLTYENGQFQTRQYWDVDFSTAGRVTDRHVAAERVLFELKEAVRLRMISDVPVGALLSGGIDSAAVVALMAEVSPQPVHTFTVGFDVAKGYNELREARTVARHCGTDHHEVVMTAPCVADLLPKLIWHMDEPLGDQAALPTYMICQYARQQVKVVLTGEGGDELFGGYPRYNWFRLAERLRHAVSPFWRERALLPMARLMPSQKVQYQAALLLAEVEPAMRHLHWVGHLTTEEKHAFYSDDLRAQIAVDGAAMMIRRYFADDGNPDMLHALMYLDMKTWLVDDVLHKVDSMSMACSLEARVPLLDHKLVELVAALPVSVKAPGLETKHLLRVMLRGIVPESTRHRRKHAFRVPVDAWFKGALRGFAREILMSDRFIQRGLFQPQAVRELLNQDAPCRHGRGQQIWNLICLELWHQQFID